MEEDQEVEEVGEEEAGVVVDVPQATPTATTIPSHAAPLSRTTSTTAASAATSAHPTPAQRPHAHGASAAPRALQASRTATPSHKTGAKPTSTTMR